MGCVLHFIVETVFEGLLHLLFAVVVLTWPGFLLGLVTGTVAVWGHGCHVWPWGFAVFVATWVAVGLLYAVWLRPRWSHVR